MTTSMITARETANHALRRRVKSTFLPLGALATVLLVSWLIVTFIPSFSGVPLGHDNPYPKGARALAQVLSSRGVDVTPASTIDGVQANSTPGTTLLVTSTDNLNEATTRSLVTSGADLVFLAPSRDTLDTLGLGIDYAGGFSADGPTAAECVLDAAQNAREIISQGTSLTVSPERESDAYTTCFPSAFGHHLIQLDTGSTLVSVLDDAYMFSNENITKAGHASLALNLLGGHEHLVWFVPEGPDPDTLLADGEPDLPQRFSIAAAMLLIAGGLAVLAAMRRLGPVASEQLPVVVRASETTRGRGRLYRLAHAHGRAGRTMQAATAAACARHLGIQRSASRDALVSAVARASGRPDLEVYDLLFHNTARSDHELVQLAARLKSLESEIKDVP